LIKQQPSDDVCNRIRDKHPDVDPVDFHEFVKDRLSIAYADSEVVGSGQVPQVVEFIIEAEESHDFDKHIGEYKTHRQRQREIIETSKIKNLVPVKPKAVQEYEIDRPIRAGGLTRVHVAIEERNLPALMKLNEQGAKFDVRDNSGQTPIDLSRSLGYVEIASFIEEVLAGVAHARLK